MVHNEKYPLLLKTNLKDTYQSKLTIVRHSSSLRFYLQR